MSYKRPPSGDTGPGFTPAPEGSPLPHGRTHSPLPISVNPFTCPRQSTSQCLLTFSVFSVTPLPAAHATVNLPL
ncbi:glutamate receptor 2-like protein [Corchorus olitorius]|uniref:Glutamate receptor 2-like protein n=1 Tax=Corchorus olitorius TaxID=93759 RepID=A0A1R3H7E4_9ROSI|nr:glutamate receptor 2-like protein [Corchorus olitorius]